MKISQNVLEHMMLAQIETVIIPNTEGAQLVLETLVEADFYTRTGVDSVFDILEEVELANWNGTTYAIIVSTEESANTLTEAFKYMKNFAGAIVVKNGLLTEGMSFNAVHTEVLEDFTILYH